MAFTHLHVHSNFSFLDGGSNVSALLDRTKAVGCDSLALTDHNGLYGAVQFYDYALKIGVKPIIGVELDVDGGHHLVLIAKNLTGYSNLCKIITRAHLSHEKGSASADIETINTYRSDLFCLSGCSHGEIPSLVIQGRYDEAKEAAKKYIEIFGRDNFLLELQNHLLPGTALLNSQIADIASELGIRLVATNNIHYAEKEDFKLQDVLACVRTITTLDDEHPERKKNAEYYIKSPNAMAGLFKKYAKAVATTGWIASQCNLDLKLGTYRFPSFTPPDGETPYSFLCSLCYDALKRLYKPITPEVTARLQHELKVINDLGFPEYFLAVWDIVNYARSKGIRCSGRGSAADSMVAYCLGITIVDPIEQGLLFERFMNPERKGMPDIDIDFDSARRDELIDYVYNRFGEDKVAMVCTVSTLRARSALRDLGKAMSFPNSDIDLIASSIPHTRASRIREAVEKLPELRDLDLDKVESLLEMCDKVDNFPRHLSVHLGGMLIGRDPLTELVPLEWATKGIVVTQFDKDDIETLGLVKMDLLGLRNLSAIEDALATIKAIHGIDLDIDNLPLDDESVYELLRTTDTIGCFQVESPGMRGLLGRLQPVDFSDLTAQISLFRPGPMQADMINPFIARRHGEEEIVYAHPSMEPVLRDTYGVILYQEQVISVAHALAGFTYGQADSLRRAMTTDRSQAEMEKIRESFVAGARARGVSKDVAEDVFSKLRAFAAYGFCKAHAASFAKIAYQTAYLKTHYPAEFMAGILNNEPMGFYPANVIIEDARRVGIRILGVDVNRSEKKFTVEYDESGVPGIRIGLSRVKDMSSAELESIAVAKSERLFEGLGDFCARTNCDKRTIENLINCGAFDSFGVSRRRLMWVAPDMLQQASRAEAKMGKDQKMGRDLRIPTPKPAPGVSGGDSEIATHHSLIAPADVSLSDQPPCEMSDIPEHTPHELVQLDYEILGLSPVCHPMEFYRKKLTAAKVVKSSELRSLPNNTLVKVAGVVVVCMRPPTRSGTIVVFLTLEDEEGLADCVVFPKAYEKCGKVIFNSPALIIEGKLQHMGKTGISIVVNNAKPVTTNYRSDEQVIIRPFKERRRPAGMRSFVRSVGI